MFIQKSLGLALAVAMASAGGASAQSTAPDNQDIVVDGVHAACTGIGLDDRLDPRWSDYSLKLSFVGQGGQYLGDERIAIAGNGMDIALDCRGPWALFRLPPGAYRIAADVANSGHRDLIARVGETGQTSVTVSFPNAGGQVAVNGPQP